MYRKKDILDVGSYKDIKLFEDYELWLRISAKYKFLYFGCFFAKIFALDNSIFKSMM